VKSPKGYPLIRTEKEVEETQILIQLAQVGWKPNLSIMVNKKSHSIRSKAFSILIFIAIRPHDLSWIWESGEVHGP
jgi:hypothetical protein